MFVLMLGGIACTSAEATLVRDGNETFAEEDWEASVEAYEQAQQEAPELAEPYYNAGNAYYRKQEYGSAQQNIENALRTAEGVLPGQANFNLGNTQFQAEEFESAIEAYKETLRLDPDDQDAKYNLELALLQLQQEQPGQQPEGEGDEPQGEQQDQGEEQQEQQDQQQGQGPSPSPEEDQQPPAPDPSEQDQPVPQPQPGELTEEQARQLLEAVASRVQTLQERLQQNVVISSNPPVKDW
jgi:tetratricopeptide (TPR) repeat protein